MGKENPDKATYAVAIAAALGYLSVHNMDKVSFKLVKGEKSEDPFGTIVGKRAFFNAISTLEDLTFDGTTDLREAVINTPNMGTNDGLTVLISDFFSDEDWKKAVDYLCYKKRQVLLIQVLTPEEVDPSYTGRVHLIDIETESVEDDRNMKIKIDRASQAAYQQAMADIREELKTFCHSRGVDYVQLCTDQPVEKALFKELLKVGIMA